MMNVIRYKASGTIQRSGMTAMSVEMWLVVAISTIEAKAARISQKA